MWYKTGTVSIDNDSQLVSGVGTSWSSQVEEGDLFSIDADQFYEVGVVNDDLSLSLVTPYKGESVVNSPYVIIRNFSGRWSMNSEIASNLAAHISEFQQALDNDLRGEDGNTILSGDVDPTVDNGVDGDWWINRTTWHLWQRVGSEWYDRILIKGEPYESAEAQAATETARDEAIAASASAQGSSENADAKALEASTSAANAEKSNVDSAIAKNEAVTARDESVAARNDSIAIYGSIEAVQSAESSAIDAKNNAIIAQGASETARDEALASATEAANTLANKADLVNGVVPESQLPPLASTWADLEGKPEVFPPESHDATHDAHNDARYQLSSAKGQPGGYAGLDSGGKISPDQLPSTGVSLGLVVALS